MADSERVAELKRKMQEAAQRTKAEAAAGEAQSDAPAPEAKAAEATPVAASAPLQAEKSIPAPAVAAAPVPEAVAAPAAAAAVTAAAAAPAPAVAPAIAAPAAPTAVSSANGSADNSTGAHALDGTSYMPAVLTPEELAMREMNRREFLTYAWGGALLLVTGATGFGLFKFLYPRFKAGEFGGKFFLGPISAVPSTEAPPEAVTAGKFWLVNTTDEGIKALYMVCTHLGCLYKWEPSTVRFECPCHGSKFSREGFYIEGPAPRSLDRFETLDENGELVVDTGAKITGAPASESPARAEA